MRWEFRAFPPWDVSLAYPQLDWVSSGATLGARVSQGPQHHPAQGGGWECLLNQIIVCLVNTYSCFKTPTSTPSPLVQVPQSLFLHLVQL